MASSVVLELRGHRFDDRRPRLMGVLNVTPDSFSDGGRYEAVDRAVARGLALCDEGADLLDVGGESTRPGAEPVPEEVERARVVPVISALVARGALVSVDTMKASVARAALDAGACMVNHVGMGDAPEALSDEAARFGAAYLYMHARGTPKTMRSLAQYEDPAAAVREALAATAARLVDRGFPRAQLALDPGLGFAKNAAQSLALLGSVASLRALGYAVCVGPSRKSFIADEGAYDPSWARSQPERSAPDERLGGTAAAVTLAVLGGADLLRVHDVAVMREAARVAHAVRRSAAGGG